MAFMTLRLVAPGVKAVQTPTLVEAAIVQSNLIRWREGLPEKLGGWAPFFAYPVIGYVREIWAWEDLDSVAHLAAAGDSGLVVITGNTVQPVGPLYNTRNPTTFVTTAGSPLVLVNDVGSNASIYEVVTLQTPASIGGIVIWPGNYPVVAVGSPDQYTINVGQNAVTGTPNFYPAIFTTTAGSATIAVSLPNSAPAGGFPPYLSVGSNFSVVLPTVIGGITLFGFYSVASIVDSGHFTIMAANQALTADSQNYGNVASGLQLIQWVVTVQQPPGGGWGDGPYGGFVPATDGNTAWGTAPAPPPITGATVVADDWTMENFGSALLANPEDQPIFRWDPTTGLQNMQVIAPAPAKVHGIFVAMPQQMIVAYGASTEGVQDPMLVAWCDAGDYTDWIASASNEAGTYRLSRGSRIVGGLQGPLQCMLWTDVGLWLMQYIGYPDVWGFLEISRGCGLIAKKAAVTVGTNVYWMSRDGFWAYAGGGAMRLQCDVWDILKNNLNLNFLRNIRCAANTGFDEVTWHCPSAASVTGENDIFVKFNVVTNEWDYGYQQVSEWVDQNVFGNPISAMPTAPSATGGAQSLIMQHEEVPDANGSPLQYSMRTGYFQLMEGEEFVFCDYCIPDFKWKRFAQAPNVSAKIQLTFFVNDWPDDDLNPPIAIGPYTVTNRSDAVDIRCRGRYFSVQIAGNDLGSFMRLGGLKFRIAPDGRNPN
jgi:hypothetical protein